MVLQSQANFLNFKTWQRFTGRMRAALFLRGMTRILPFIGLDRPCESVTVR